MEEDSQILEYPEDPSEWCTALRTQVRIITKQLNSYFQHDPEFIISSPEALVSEMADGTRMLKLLQYASFGYAYFPTMHIFPTQLFFKLENWNLAFEKLRGYGIVFVGIGAQDLVNGNLKLLLGVLHVLFLRAQSHHTCACCGSSAKYRLIEWIAQTIGPDYVSMDVKHFDFERSLQDGIVFGALFNAVFQLQKKHLESVIFPMIASQRELNFILHSNYHSQPSLEPLIEINNRDSLQLVEEVVNKSDQFFGIPAILEAVDIVQFPDSLANMTYISYFRDCVDFRFNQSASRNNSFILKQIYERIREHYIQVYLCLSTSASNKHLPRELVYLISKKVIYVILEALSLCPFCNPDKKCDCYWEKDLMPLLRSMLIAPTPTVNNLSLSGRRFLK